MSEERPFPDADRRKLGRFHRLTAVVFFFGISSSCAFASCGYGQRGDMPVNSQTAPWLLPMLLVFAWCGYRTVRFFCAWPCPECSAPLKVVNGEKSRTGNILLACRSCEVHWDCGIEAGDGGPTSGN